MRAGGTIAIPTEIPELSVNVTGDVTLGADERTFDIFTGDWACDSIGGSVSLNSNGNLRVCANVPGFGQACDTLD